MNSKQMSLTAFEEWIAKWMEQSATRPTPVRCLNADGVEVVINGEKLIRINNEAAKMAFSDPKLRAHLFFPLEEPR